MTTKDYCFDLEQLPENALASKIKNDVIDKLLKCSTKDEVKDVLNTIITDNYDNLDIEAIRTGDAPVGAILDSFIACSLEESTKDYTSTQVQVGDLLKNAIDLVCNPPSFNIPVPFPIIDISADFLKQLLLAILKLAIKIILSVLKKLLQLIIDICASGATLQNPFGGLDVTDTINNSFLGVIDDSNNYINDIFAAFGIDSNGYPATSILNGENSCNDESAIDTTIIKSTSQFLDDISSILTPMEMCNLFDNNANDQTFKAIEELIKYEHPNMGIVFNNRTKIKELFKLLSKKIDPTLCEAIRNNADKIVNNPELCLTEDGRQIRKNLLQKRNLSDEQIESLLDKEREKQKANLEKITNILASIKTDPNSIFGDQQDIFCKSGQPGLISMEQMPSLKSNMTITTDFIYNIFTITFLKEISFYGSILVTQEKIVNEDDPVIPKFTTLSIQDSEGNTQTITNTLNPTFLQRTSFGSFSLCDKNGKTSSSDLKSFYSSADNAQDDEGNVDVQKVISVTSKKDAKKLGGDNVYIVNYLGKQKIANDLYNTKFGLLQTGSASLVTIPPTTDPYSRIKDFISYDINTMSIIINIPTKYVPFGVQTTEPDFKSIESTDNITIYVTGTV
jgi:hypothetical protein